MDPECFEIDAHKSISARSEVSRSLLSAAMEKRKMLSLSYGERERERAKDADLQRTCRQMGANRTEMVRWM